MHIIVILILITCITGTNGVSTIDEYIDPTLPPLLPGKTPKCSLTALQYQSNISSSSPISVNYILPRGCPFPWSHVVLQLSASAFGFQKDRIAAIWVDGAEILRTSTPYSVSSHIHWQVQKDVTRYTALLRGPTDNASTLSITFENDDDVVVFPDVYSLNISFNFYHDDTCQEDEKVPILKLPSSHPKIRGLYDHPADLIIPISGPNYWFVIKNETDVHVTALRVPRNTYRAVLEVYVSPHDNDTNWYANPFKSKEESGDYNGAFRQVVVSIDKRYAGGAMPFPVIYPGSINPYFWAPVAAIGAYNHPSYDINLTPFLGILLDGSVHEIGLTVQYGRPFWLVSANLHLWLDSQLDIIKGELIRYKVPPIKMKHQGDWVDEDGKSSIKGKVIERFSGWVSSSHGNITTKIQQKLKFKSRVEAKEKGAMRLVEMKVKSKLKIRTQEKRENDTGSRQVSVRRDMPLSVATVSSERGGKSIIENTRVSHQLMEVTKIEIDRDVELGTVDDRQYSEGSMVKENGVVLHGKGDTMSTYKFRDKKGCYLRRVIMEGGKIKEDVNTASCASIGNS